MPDDAQQGFRLVDGKFVLTVNRPYPRLQWWVTPVAQQSLRYAGQQRQLTEFAHPDQLLTIAGIWLSNGRF